MFVDGDDQKDDVLNYVSNFERVAGMTDPKKSDQSWKGSTSGLEK
jgi:hypothetical protein